MKGSLTVEAAYIFPLCFLVLGIVCYLGIYEYNRAVLKMTGYECILQTMEERDEDEDGFKENLLRRAEQAAKERTFGMVNLKTSAKITASKVSISLQGVQTIFQAPLEVTVVYERTFPELTLRMMKEITGEFYEGNVETGTE